MSPKSSWKCLRMDTLNPNIKAMEYAVRGPLVIRAREIEEELQKVEIYIYCDIKNSFILHFLRTGCSKIF